MSNTLSTEKPTDKPQQEQDSRSLPCSAFGELLGNLEEWSNELRKDAHPVTLSILRAKSTISDLERLLHEAYIFMGMPHKALSPWRNALDEWQEKVEEITGWHHFYECEKFKPNSQDNLPEGSD